MSLRHGSAVTRGDVLFVDMQGHGRRTRAPGTGSRHVVSRDGEIAVQTVRYPRGS